MDISKEFRKIRDIPYRIPLSPDEIDDCCSGKSIRLFNILKNAGYNVRYRICTFLWSDLNLPNKVKKISHKDNTSHEFIEVEIDGRWIIVDSTWDKSLKSIFLINDWDGKSDTNVAVPIKEILSPGESLEYIKNISTKKAVIVDLERNAKFYKAFNDWLEEIRNK